MALFLCSCGAKPISADTIPLTDSDELVCGVSETQTGYCITDYGILYPKNHAIRYYDFSTDGVYILCDKANCRHNSEKCSAWYEDSTLLEGLALYQNHCYMFRCNYTDNTWDFIRMDLTGNNVQTIASLDMGSQEGDGGWLLAGVSEAYYCEDTVWYSADYTYADKSGRTGGCRQYRGIRLTDGSHIVLNELTLDGTTFQLMAVTKKYILLNKRSSELKLLSNKDFEQEMENGTFGSLFDDSEDPYYDYYRKWWPYNGNMTDSFLRYSTETGEITVLEEFPTIFQTDDEGAVWQFNPQYYCVGEYKGMLLCNWIDWKSDEEDPLSVCQLFLWDIEKNTKTEVTSYHGGTALYGGDGEYTPAIYDGSKFLYVTYENVTEPMDYLEFNLDTMESSSKLFELMYGSDFHILKDTPDMFVARKYIDVPGDSIYTIYIITKEDFYDGNLNKAIKLRL